MATVAEPVVDADGLVEIQAAVLRLAVQDYKAGPGDGRGPDAAERQRDFDSAYTFLERAGLLDRLHQIHGTPVHHAYYRQLTLSFEEEP